MVIEKDIMATPQRDVLADLPAPRGYRATTTKTVAPVYGLQQKTWVNFFIIFLVVAILAYLVIAWINPTWAQQSQNGQATGQLDNAKAAGYSLLIGLIVAFLFWLASPKA
jgi:hypothetical protein